jgi:hypothetical protein
MLRERKKERRKVDVVSGIFAHHLLTFWAQSGQELGGSNPKKTVPAGGVSGRVFAL